VTDNHTHLGLAGEQLAAEHLCRCGYTILHRNYRTRSGEIDIIARHGQTVVFIEVKTRKNELFGSPAAAVTVRKQAQISRVAQEFLQREGLVACPARFDVVSVLAPPGTAPRLEVITDAFDLVG
jgi:putative endonuclease